MSFALGGANCDYIETQEITDHKKRLSDLVKHFNASKLTVQMYRKIKTIEDQSDATRALEGFIKDIAPEAFLDETFVLTPEQIKRVKLRIDQHEKQMSKPLGAMEAIVKIPNAILRKTPIAKTFIQELDLAKNYERNSTNQLAGLGKQIHRNMRHAFFAYGYDAGLIGIKQFKRIQKLENDYRTSEDPLKMKEVLSELDAIYKSQEGIIVREFIHLITTPKNEFNSTVKAGITSAVDPVVQGIDKSGDRVGQPYNSHIVKAVESSRKLLDNMGYVNVNALRFMRDATWLKVTGKEYKDYKQEGELLFPELKRLNENVKQARKRLELGIKQGGYFPDLILDNVMEIKARFNQILAEESPTRITDLIDGVAQDIQTMIKTDPPANVKARNDILERDFSRNPLYVLEQYGVQAIQFNKLNHVATEYQKVLKILSNPEIKAEYIEGLNNYLEGEYTIATKGLANRPEWMNKTIRTIKMAETLKAMGFGFTGAVRNVLGAQFWVAEQGAFTIKQNLNLYNTGTYGKVEIKKLVNTIEKDQGFRFGDIGLELVAEGILTKEGAETLDFRYNIQTGQVEAKQKDSQMWKNFEKVAGGFLKTGLTFHRWGENWSRKWMFRLSLIESLEQFRNRPEYWAKHGGLDLTAENWKANPLVRQAANLALFSVNHFAGEYALHSKARLLTGVPGKVTTNGKLINQIEVGATAATSLATGLLHYPMFILDMQYKKIEGGAYSAMAKQWDSPELKYLAKYASLYAFIQLLSVGLNADLNRIAENDTLAKLHSLKLNIAGPDPEDLDADGTLKPGAERLYGLLGEVTGPFVDDAWFTLALSGAVGMPDSFLGRVAMGYDNYLEAENASQKDRAFWNRLGTFAGFMGNKIVPAIVDGRGATDVFRHTFALYPSRFTKGAREYIPFLKKKKNLSPLTPLESIAERKGVKKGKRRYTSLELLEKIAERKAKHLMEGKVSV